MKRILIAGITLLLINVSVGLTDPTPHPADPQILTLVNQLHQDSLYATVNSLVNFYTRHTFSDTISATQGIGAARQWLRLHFSQTGAQSQLFPWTTSWGGNPFYPCYNVHATLPGSSSRHVILGAHYDSRTVNANDITGFAPGADDDGSGVAALLEMSRILAGETLSATFVSAAFAGEEQSLLGSEAYASYLQSSSTVVTGMIALDMIGHIVHPGGLVDSTTVRCYSGDPMGSSSRRLARYVKWVGESYSDGLTVTLYPAIDRPGRGSDHISFYNVGYPSCRLIETGEDVAYQHGPSDVPANMSFSYARKVARLTLGVTTMLATAPVAPGPPSVTNVGDGQSVLVSWPDSLVIPPGGMMRVSYRLTDQLYWENIASTTQPPPLMISSLDSGQRYEIGLSITDALGHPSLFGQEMEVYPISAPAPEGFDTYSSSTGVQLTWQPSSAPSTLEYLVERAIPGQAFAPIVTLPHPDSAWFDNTVQPHQLYQYRLRTRNSQMVLGAPSPTQEGQLATHDQGILLFDATVDGSGPPNAPTDQQADSFYTALTAAYEVAGQWDHADSLLVGSTLSDADLAPYAVVLVYADYFNGDMSADTMALRKYLNNGGKLFLCGWRLSRVLLGSIAYAHQFGPGDFIYDLTGIDSIRVAAAPQFIGTTGQAGYPNLVVNSAYYPNGLLLSEAAWTSSYPIDVTVIGTFVSNQGGSSVWHGKPVAWKGYGSQPSWVLLDAPLFYMTEASATAFLNQALDDLDAPPNGVTPDENTTPFTFRLEAPRPNPFNGSVAISYQLSAFSQVRLTVWDTAGRKVGTLVDGWQGAGEHQALFEGSELTSGVYLLRLEAGGNRATGKVVMVK